MTVPVADTTPGHPLADANPDALTALFDANPMDLDDASFDHLIAEMRRRADIHASEEAKKAAAPKKPAPKTKPSTGTKAASMLDKPVGELSLGDLLK